MGEPSRMPREDARPTKPGLGQINVGSWLKVQKMEGNTPPPVTIVACCLNLYFLVPLMVNGFNMALLLVSL